MTCAVKIPHRVKYGLRLARTDCSTQGDRCFIHCVCERLNGHTTAAWIWCQLIFSFYLYFCTEIKPDKTITFIIEELLDDSEDVLKLMSFHGLTHQGCILPNGEKPKYELMTFSLLWIWWRAATPCFRKQQELDSNWSTSHVRKMRSTRIFPHVHEDCVFCVFLWCLHPRWPLTLNVLYILLYRSSNMRHVKC